MAYLFNDKVYNNWDEMAVAVMEAFPGYHKEHYMDIIETEVEEVDDPQSRRCADCGVELDALTVPFLASKGVCSWHCLEGLGYDYS